MLPRSALTFLVALFLCPGSLRAQDPPSLADAQVVAPAHVSHVEGTVILERDGKPDDSPLNMPLLSGDRLKTQDGRVEVLFADGSALHLDARTTLDVQSDDLARLIDGRLRLAIAGPSRTVAYRIDSPAGSVRISQAGEYRVSMLHGDGETQLELAVIRGSGEIFTDEGSTAVHSGERAYASAGLAPSYAYTYNSANWDAFDRWSESRRDTRMGVSAQYLPEDVRPYASTLDEYGDWRYQQAYGYVWYPRVASGWRPYYYGRWISYPRFGWTWIGADAFSWPTHHYGRWGVSAGVWFWIPARHWAPAYVSWAYAPGYVSWCPLGFDNRPVISINIFNVGPRYYSSAYAWTAVSYSHFGHGYYVHQRAVNWDRFDRRTTWQAGRAAPLDRNIAVPRGSSGAAPIRWAGAREVGGQRPNLTGAREDVRSGFRSQPGSGRPPTSSSAVPRASSSPRYVNRGDQIIRSQTERPTAPRRSGTIGDAAVAGSTVNSGSSRGDVAVPRTAPAGPARRVESAPQTFDPARGDRAPFAPNVDRAQPRYGARPDSPAYAPQRAPSSARPDSPAYAPQPSPGYARPDARGYGRPDDSGYRARPANPVPGAAAAPRESGRSPEQARPRGGSESRPSPSGGYNPPPASASPPPNSGFRQAPPPQRGAPPAQGGGAQARPRGGRGGA